MNDMIGHHRNSTSLKTEHTNEKKLQEKTPSLNGQQYSWPRGYKTFVMLKSAEHEIFSANKYEHAITVDIFISICKECFMLSYV